MHFITYTICIFDLMGRKSIGYKKFETYEGFDVNPFTLMTGIGRGVIRSDEYLLRPYTFENGKFIEGVDIGTGATGIIGTPYMGKEKRIDRKKYVKYYDELSELLMKDSEFSVFGYRCLQYIMCLVKKNSNVVSFAVSGVCRTTGMKRSEAFDGMADLLRVGVVARKGTESYETYWINPQFIFRGDRSRLIDKDNGVSD